MINRIKKLFSGVDAASAATQDGVEAHALAAAVLMVEAARLDGDFDLSERQSIRALVTEHFGLDEEEADALINEAESVHDDANHLVRFTRTIKDSYPPEDLVRFTRTIKAYPPEELSTKRNPFMTTPTISSGSRERLRTRIRSRSSRCSGKWSMPTVYCMTMKQTCCAASVASYMYPTVTGVPRVSG